MSHRVITICNNLIEIGVAPDIGGRIVSAKVIGKKNILKSDESVWKSTPKSKKPFNPQARWKIYNGQIVWVGPQSEWWMHQDKNLRRLLKKAVWPPDPYLEFGDFEVLERSNTRIVMKGPCSEFTGVQLTKRVEIDGHTVHFKVTAENIRKKPVAWDLWLNARFDGYCRCYVPLKDPAGMRLEGKESRRKNLSQFTHTQGYLCLDPKQPEPQCKCRMAKAFIPADRGFMAAFVNSQAIIIRFKTHPNSLIHPEHSLVELYNYTTHNRAQALNELEYHSPYKTLAPNEKMETEQYWEIHQFPCEQKNHSPYIEFLNNRTK